MALGPLVWDGSSILTKGNSPTNDMREFGSKVSEVRCTNNRMYVHYEVRDMNAGTMNGMYCTAALASRWTYER
jgi:hypothetical protein